MSLALQSLVKFNVSTSVPAECSENTCVVSTVALLEMSNLEEYLELNRCTMQDRLSALLFLVLCWKAAIDKTFPEFQQTSEDDMRFSILLRSYSVLFNFWLKDRILVSRNCLRVPLNLTGGSVLLFKAELSVGLLVKFSEEPSKSFSMIPR